MTEEKNNGKIGMLGVINETCILFSTFRQGLPHIQVERDCMIPKIKELSLGENYTLNVTFDDGKNVVYDVKDDMKTIKSYMALREEHGLFEQVHLDESRTCVYWNDEIDLPSDAIYEYGTEK